MLVPMTERQVASGLATIEAEPDGTFVLRVDRSLQSRVDLADPTRLLFEYVRRIGDVLDALAPRRQPLAVLHIGGAGLTLPRYVAATRPGSRQVVLEPDEDLTEFVREALPLRKRTGIKVRGSTGRAGICGVYDASMDAVIVDAFEHETVPANLVTAEFVEQCARVLRPNGVAVLNLVDGAAGLPFARRVAATVLALGNGLVLVERPVLRGRRFGNVVLVGCRGLLPDVDGTAASPPYDVVPLREFAGQARPLTDAEPFVSPATPAGTFRRR